MPSIAIRDRELAFAPITIGALLREIAINASRDHAVDRGLAFAQIAIDASQDRAVDCDLAIVPIAIDTVRDRAVDRDLAKRRGASLDREVVGLEFTKHRVVERRRS